MADRVRLVCTEGGRSEVLWVEPLGADRFRIDNIPAIVTTLSMGDVITASAVGRDLYKLAELIEPGGHSTIHLLLSDSDAHAHAGALADLAHLGCTTETLTLRLVGLDVPPGADIAAVDRVLADATAAGTWAVTVVNRQHGARF